jgi:hypothetical protein
MKIKSGLINKLVAQHKQLGVYASIKIIDAIDASIERLGLSADITFVSKLAVAIELGDFIIHRAVADGVLVDDMSTVVDQLVMDFFKGLSENITPTDSVAWRVEKPLGEEVLGLEDYVALLTKKAPEDVVGTSDSIDRFDVTKGLAQATVFSDDMALLSQGYVADAFYFADDYIGTSRTA